MTDVPGTSPERPIIWFPGRPATGSRRRPQKTFFLLNYQFFCWSPKSPLNVPWRSWTLGTLGDLQETSLGRRVPAGNAVLTAYGPSFCLGMTSTGSSASKQFAPIRRSTLMSSLSPSSLDIFSRRSHFLSFLVVAISQESTGISFFQNVYGNFIHFGIPSDTVVFDTYRPSTMDEDSFW